MKTWYEANMSGDQGLVIDEATGANIAVVYDKANAKLIAAAPDLLEALEALLIVCKEAQCSDSYWLYKQARAAIQKATGE